MHENTLINQSFDTDQHLAVEMCIDPDIKIASVTGEAGTGKTLVLGEAVRLCEAAGMVIEVCAPTGRAAARIRESTGHYARTCHRLLGFGAPDPNDPDDQTIPSRDSINPIPADGIFVDESSMLSEDLYRALMSAKKKGAFIRFFGDIRQLPPINTEDPPFRRLLEKFAKVILTKNYRSSDGIVKAAQQINRGSVPSANDKFKVVNAPKTVGLSILDKFIDIDMFDPKKAQIICPTKVGKLGTEMINGYVQQKINLNPDVMELRYEADNGDVQLTRIRPGDKILWTKNDYNLNLYNGMIGRVLGFDHLSGDIQAEFEGRDYYIPSVLERFDQNERSLFRYDPRKFIDLAYAITTHKSQGSEFERIIIMLYWSTVQSRQNFYTAVTRGRNHVTVIAMPGGLKVALKNDPALEPRKPE